MKKLLFLLLFIGWKEATGQNLVPNPSFEEYKELKCNLNVPALPPYEKPKIWFQSILFDWILPTNVPSQVYSILLDKNCEANPVRFLHVNPKHGFTMAQIFLLADYTIQPKPNGRTYLQVKLREKLVEGQSYLAGGYYTLSDNYGAYAANNLGMLFTPEAVGSDTTFILNYKPQINEIDVNKNPIVWKTFGGCITSNGDEQYLTIGGFLDDNHTKVVQILSGDTRGSDVAAYFIDSVFVEKVKSLDIPNVITPNGDSFNEKLVINGLVPGQWTLSINNRWGKSIYHDSNYKNDWGSREIDAGTYFYSVQHNICRNLFYKGTITLISQK